MSLFRWILPSSRVLKFAVTPKPWCVRQLSDASATLNVRTRDVSGSGAETSKRKVMKQRISPDTLDLIRGDGVCAAYCVPRGVSLSKLCVKLKNSVFQTKVGPDDFVTFKPHSVAPLAADVVHVDLRSEVPVVDSKGESARRASSLLGHAFCFTSGAVVCWGLPSHLCASILDMMATFQEHDVDTKLVPHTSYALSATGAKQVARMQDFEHEFRFTIDSNRFRPTFRHDEIRLVDFSDATHLLSISYGLAQSVRLLLYEEAIDSLVSRTRQLPDQLASRGQVTLSRGQLRRLIGELLAARYSVLLVSDILDTPEYFWQHADLEGVHLECAGQVELRERARLLDARTEVIKDALAILNNEVSASASDRVERAILFLIGVEVVIEVAKVVAPSLL